MPRLILKVSRKELSRMTLRRWSSFLPQILTRPKTGPERQNCSILEFNERLLSSHPWEAWQPEEEAMLVVHKADRCYTTATNYIGQNISCLEIDGCENISFEKPVATVRAMRQKMWEGHLEGYKLEYLLFCSKNREKDNEDGETDLYRQQSSRPPSPGRRSKRGS